MYFNKLQNIFLTHVILSDLLIFLKKGWLLTMTWGKSSTFPTCLTISNIWTIWKLTKHWQYPKNQICNFSLVSRKSFSYFVILIKKIFRKKFTAEKLFSRVRFFDRSLIFSFSKGKSFFFSVLRLHFITLTFHSFFFSFFSPSQGSFVSLRKKYCLWSRSKKTTTTQKIGHWKL